MDERWADVKRPYSAEDVVRLRGAVKIEYTLARLGAERLWRLLHTEPYVRALGAQTGHPGRADGAGRAEGDLRQRLAGGRRHEHRRADLSRPKPVPGRQRADAGAADQQRLAAGRPDRAQRGDRRPDAALARAHRGRRRGRLRRRAQRLRVDEGHDRGRGRRRALRRPALLVEEMRPHGRQGAGAHPGGHRQARGGPAGRRRAGRAHADRRPHRCPGAPSCSPAMSTRATGRSSPASGRWKGFYVVRGGLEQAIARGLAYAPYADLVWCETSTPDLEEARLFAEGDPRPLSRQAAGLQLLAVVQLEASCSTTSRSPRSSGTWRRWATSSSSSPWPASMP